MQLFRAGSLYFNFIDDNGFMLRDSSLIPLSHQHQHALALCVRLDRALQKGVLGVLDLAAWQLEVHQLYASEIQFHFTAEEQILFPAAQRFPELAPLAAELSGEHIRLREYFVRAEQGTLDQGELQEFVTLLVGHVRKEERQLFEALPKHMKQDELKSLGTALESALKDAERVCRLSAIKPR